MISYKPKKDESIDKILSKFKKLIKKSGIIKEMNDRRYHQKKKKRKNGIHNKKVHI